MIYIDENERVCGYKTAVALGLFDGVHLGHQKVIGQAAAKKADDVKPAVFTFKTDSVTSKGHDGRIEMLLTDDEKSRHFESLGVECMFSPEFSHFKDMSDEEFVRVVLKEKLNACFAVCGEDFRFGKNAAGNADKLREFGEKYGIEVSIVGQVSLNGEAVSSTEIRRCIRNGDISKANAMLGYKYGYTLPVEHGFERGRTWNFPTINQAIPKGLVLPRFGVYCSKVEIGGRKYIGVTNIGVKPTVKVNIAPLAETYILGYEGDLYGRTVTVELYEFVREERVFDSFDELKAEIAKNTQFTKQYFDKT